MSVLITLQRLSPVIIYGYDIIQRGTGNVGTVDECLLQSGGEEGRVGGEKGGGGRPGRVEAWGVGI